VSMPSGLSVGGTHMKPCISLSHHLSSNKNPPTHTNTRTHARTHAHTEAHSISSHSPSRTNPTTHPSNTCVNQKHKRVIVTCHLLHPDGELRRALGLQVGQRLIRRLYRNAHKSPSCAFAGRPTVSSSLFTLHSSLEERMLQAFAHGDSPLRVQDKDLLEKVGKLLDLLHILLCRGGPLESFQDTARRGTSITRCVRAKSRNTPRCPLFRRDQISSRVTSSQVRTRSFQIKTCAKSSVGLHYSSTLMRSTSAFAPQSSRKNSKTLTSSGAFQYILSSG
jgi:hypothetical protein